MHANTGVRIVIESKHVGQLLVRLYRGNNYPKADRE